LEFWKGGFYERERVEREEEEEEEE